MRVTTKLRNVLVLSALVAGAAPASADTTFGTGALIIPASATYQHDCGAVAMYGLVYDVLRANAYLEANKATFCPTHTAAQTCKIEIYYTYNANKKSPNRCTPTNRHAGPAYIAGPGGSYPAAPAPLHNDTKWNDGCDFELYDSTLTPVTLVNNSNTAIANDTTISTINTTTKTAAPNAVYPGWANQSILWTASAATRVDTVRYWGGSFIISDVDAPLFLKLISATLPAPANLGRANDKSDGSGNWVGFEPFRANGANAFGYPVTAATCSFGTTLGGYVNIHRVRAVTGVTAPTPRIFTEAPPRLALLAKNSAPAASGNTGRVDDGILQKYLQNGGLKFTGSNGCPPGGYHAGTPAICPSGGTPGQIYDTFDYNDLVTNKLNATSGGVPIYKMLWAPHWEWINTDNNTTGLPSAFESATMTNVANFLNGSTGLMAECASIETFEGQYEATNNRTQGVSAGKLQTCQNASGVCSATAMTFGIDKDPPGTAPTGNLRNCTDPTLTSGNCAYFASPADPFVQLADYNWNQDSGRVDHWLPTTGTPTSIYRPGVVNLVSAMSSLNRANLPAPHGSGTDTTARAAIVGDFATRNNKDNSAAKGNILYLAGHDMAGSVAGTKMVLQTLLQLGDPTVAPVTEEVSRNSPIAYVVPNTSGVNTSSILQGTFERVTPAGSTLTLTSSADNNTFRFPDVKGHMRAAPTSAYAAGGASFTTIDTAQLWDAADGIPNSSGASPNSYTTAGCTRFAAGCRTIFTNVAGGFNPTRTYIDQSNIGTVGPLMASALTSTEHAVLMQRVNFGIDGSTAGTFKPMLGGVDRSTVAIIPQSTVAGTTRPMMAYFGATDGMMHAVCANTVTPCTAVGQELWAFMPRNQLSSVRFNTTRIDGSPRVTDLFGDFSNAGTRSFRTILTFHTTSGDPTIAGKTPSVYALDVTNPANPTIVWEYTLTNPASRGVSEMGQGLTITQGPVNIAGVSKVAAFVQTSNGGTGGAGSVTTAINVETGAVLWTSSQLYTNPPRGSGTPVPASAIPGGAVAVDTDGFGTYTDIVVPNIYGDIWVLDATTGISKYGANPLFRFNANGHPFGAPAAIYSNAGTLFAVAAAGGYHDLTAGTQWSTPPHKAVAVQLNTPLASAPLSETSGPPYVPFTVSFGTGEASFSQVQVIGGELYITTDTTDINSLTYGTGTTDTGHAYKVDLTNTSSPTNVVIRGGASAVASVNNAVYVGSKNEGEQLAAAVTNTTGEDASKSMGAKVARKLWLRTL